ncbi:bpX6 domain-containing protein [Kitasatospora sp. NBC_00070]|uniref:bpX6 domain-containing protein n=1 Tax=Kitasatospora sp. NBC_00070 TaxID=2975962 RepID=UPI003256467C
MSTTPDAAFRAAVTATGFVLDVPVIGAAEAAARVVESWQDGAELRRLPDGRWLFTLAAAVEIRADRAPGLPVVRTGTGGSATLGADATPVSSGQLALASHGLTILQPIAGLTELDPSGWLDLTGLTVHRPRPLGAGAPEAAPVVEALPERPRPDLRAAAGIAPPTERARLLRADAPAAPRRRLSRFLPRLRPSAAVGPAVVGALIALVPALLLFTSSTLLAPGHGLHGWVLGLVLAVAVAAARSRRIARTAAAAPPGSGSGAAAGASGRAKPRRPLFGPLLARLTMRTAGNLVRGRHARYLRELTRAFEQRQWEDALRDAIRLSGERSAGQESWLTLGLPRRRTGELRATPRTGESGAASPLSGLSVHQHLAELYRAAAEDLERTGRIDEAAFVLADLLDAPAEAVALLARHGRTAAAAELAEGRELAADLVVRLWWQAGERERAVRTAHRRGAFASAVDRLAAEAPDSARELRAAWAAHCRESGDRLGAAEALWPDETLRPSAVGDLREAVALGGATRSRALPYLLALGAGEATRALALAVLESEGDPVVTGRSVLAAGLARLPAADPAVDRELATAAARMMVRDGGFGGDLAERDRHASHRALLGRADPLVAADLAKPYRPARNGERAAAVHTAADRPGTLPVLDAALLGSGAVLVACGQAGVRLLTSDGRTKAQWDVPADQLVLADHDGSALLVATYGSTKEITRLDLATRTVRPWTTLRARWIAGSYDGRHLITGDAEGIVVLDTLAAGPTVVWRELGGGERLVGTVARTADRCAAVVVSPLPDGSPLVELWRWDLPGWELRSRLELDAFHPDQCVPLAGAGLLTALPQTGVDGASDRTALRLLTGRPPAPDLDLAGIAPSGPIADADDWVLPVPDPAGTGFRLHAGSGVIPTATVLFPGADLRHTPGLRRHADAVTYWHRSGRVLATTPDGATVLANLRVTGTR